MGWGWGWGWGTWGSVILAATSERWGRCDPDKVQFLLLGFDEFYGEEEVIMCASQCLIN